MTLKDYLFRFKWRFAAWIGIYGVWVAMLTTSSIFEGNTITQLTKFNVTGFLLAAAVYIGANILEVLFSVSTSIYQSSLEVSSWTICANCRLCWC